MKEEIGSQASPFNLSENIYADGTRLLVEDVKEFIKKLKDFCDNHVKCTYGCGVRMVKEIDKLLGLTLAGKSEEKN